MVKRKSNYVIQFSILRKHKMLHVIVFRCVSLLRVHLSYHSPLSVIKSGFFSNACVDSRILFAQQKKVHNGISKQMFAICFNHQIGGTFLFAPRCCTVANKEETKKQKEQWKFIELLFSDRVSRINHFPSNPTFLKSRALANHP